MNYRMLTVLATALAISASAAIAQTPIEKIAPENTVLILGTKNLQTVKDHFKKTALWTLWETNEAKEIRADVVKKLTEGLDQMFQELGVEKDALVAPSGPVGFALFTTRDPELDTPAIAFIALADYGDEENAKKSDSIVQAALARGEKEDEIEFDHKDVSGRTVYTIDLAKMQAKQAEGEFDDIDMDGGMPLPVPTPGDVMKAMDKLHYVRDGRTLMLCSDLDTLTEAIDIADGKPAGQRATDRTELQAVMTKLGDADFYGVLLTRDVLELIAGSDPMGMTQMMRPTLREMFGEVQGYGLGVRFDAPTAMVEQTLTAYMPNGKKGLTALADLPAPRATLPPFVGADTVSYYTFSFRFSGLMDVIRSVVNSNPMLVAQAGPQIDEIAPTVNQITSALGTNVYYAVSATQPFTPENRQTVFAVECTKPQDFENLLAPMAAQAGIEARDFLGQRIYTLPEGMAEMMMPMPGMEMGSLSLGIGGGFMMIGSTPSVEQALRATGQPGGTSLAANAEFQRASASLSKDPVIAWGYTNTVDSLELTLAAQRKMMEDSIKQMNEDAEEWAGEEDAGAIKEMQAEAEASMREAMKIWDRINFDLLRRHLGPASWQIRSTDDGFTMQSFQLDATPK